MPYEAHPGLVTPPDAMSIWRYMDFAKFVGLLETQGLWFSRSDQVEDPLEGSYTDAELEHIRALPPPPAGRPNAHSATQALLGAVEFMRGTTFINCWRLGSDESIAMWDLYGSGSGVVAIKSTVGILKQQFAAIESRVFLASVRYLDWASTPWDNNAIVMCARKHRSYEHENEFRAIIWDQQCISAWSTKELGLPSTFQIPVGISVPVNANELISEVMIGPREQDWVQPLVEGVAKRYALSASVTRSTLLKRR
jgi:hypothetical protein